jgi:hypothetical protein
MDEGMRDERPVSRLARIRLWLAGYEALEVVAYRDNDHLLRDAGLLHEAALDDLRAWRIIGFLLLPRSGRE